MEDEEDDTEDSDGNSLEEHKDTKNFSHKNEQAVVDLIGS